MDWSIVLSLAGIVVSVVVGWASYRFADRRARNQKYRTAKASVLQELSKSLGEDSIPTPAIIQATMRSVLREAGDPKIEIKVGEVLDDLMRQVTADPFLDGERRSKLQGDIEQVRSQTERSAELKYSSDNLAKEYQQFSSVWPSAATFIGVFMTAVTTAVMLAVSLERWSNSDANGTTSPNSILQRLLEQPAPEELRGVLITMLLVPVFLFLLLRLLLDDDFREIFHLFKKRKDDE